MDWRDEYQEIVDAKPFDLEIHRRMGRKIRKIEIEEEATGADDPDKMDLDSDDFLNSVTPSRSGVDSVENDSSSNGELKCSGGLKCEEVCPDPTEEVEGNLQETPTSAHILSESQGSVTVSPDLLQEQPLGFIAVAISYPEVISRFLTEVPLRVKVWTFFY